MLFQNHIRDIVFLTAAMFLSLSLIACSVSPSATVDSDDTPTSSAESENSRDTVPCKNLTRTALTPETVPF